MRKFDNVPLTIPVKDSIEVRGEGVISWENFGQIYLSLGEPYGHPRNLASGSTIDFVVFYNFSPSLIISTVLHSLNINFNRIL